MKRQPWILAGGALGLLMAAAPLGAYPLQGSGLQHAPGLSDDWPAIRIQADCPKGASAEDCAQAKPNEGKNSGKKEQKREKSAAPAEPERKPEKQRQKQAEPARTEGKGPARTEKAAPASESEQKPRQKPEKSQKKAEPAKQAEPQPEARPAQPEAAPAEGKKPSGQAAEPKAGKEKLRDYLKKKQSGDETEPARTEPAKKPKVTGQEKPAEAPAAPKPEQKPAQANPDQKPAEATKSPAKGGQPAEQATEPGAKKDKLRDYLKKKQSSDDTGPTEAQPGTTKPAGDARQTGKDQPSGQQPPKTGQPAPGEQSHDGKAPATQPVLPADTREQALPKGEAKGRPLPENAAPLPDSAKRHGERGERGKQRENGKTGQPEQANQNQQPVRPPRGQPAPRSDSAAQTALEKIGRIESVEAMKGRRIDRDRWREERRRRHEQRHDRNDGQVVKEVGDRIVVKFGDNIYVDNRDSNVRLERHARDSYVEELPGDFTRYTIVRDNGVRVVTIRNARGDIVRRSRIMPDNREVVLYYVPETYYDRIEGGYADAGADLPPLQLDIPANQYILDAQYAEPDDYYTYLDAPPVEQVERIYSVDEVVHSARIRDKVRRIDLDTITFDTGSAEIGEDQVNGLQALGDAINKILEQNPAETFLIEGHTDAVGSDESNLVLSDERAQAVAEALTGVFDIPPENLTTQGYGEQYLKVDTESASRENRRVAVRRITPLVTPIASAQ